MVAVLVIGLILQPGATGGDLATLGSHVEHAIRTGQTMTLERARKQLLADIERGSSTRDKRFMLAYVTWRLAFLPGPARNVPRAALLDEAEAQLRAITDDHRSDAEALALLGSIYGTQIAEGGSALRLGPRATRAMEEAGRLAPQNPRVALLRGIHFLFTPEMFGGGVERAEAELRRAEQLYARERDHAWPNWGQADTLGWLGQALAKRRDIDGARAAYARALALEPDHVWIRSLVAALDAK